MHVESHSAVEASLPPGPRRARRRRAIAAFLRAGIRSGGGRALLSIVFWAAGCARAPENGRGPRAAGEFMVATYNLRTYNLIAVSDEGEPYVPKDEASRQAVAEVILDLRPDVLVVQEIGNAALLNELHFRLKAGGWDYPHVEFLQRGDSEFNQALFSRFPIVARHSSLEERYSIGEARVSVFRGFLDVELETPCGYRFRVMAAHLKSKVYHRLGQTEMRRNEARLLGNRVRRALRDDPELNLIVLGDFNDMPDSAPLREVRGDRGEYLDDLRPADAVGDVWTHFGAGPDVYSRIDYILLSRGMREEWVAERGGCYRGPRRLAASDHRPVYAVFRPPASK